MKYGIDNLIKIIEDFGNAVKKFHNDVAETQSVFLANEADKKINGYKDARGVRVPGLKERMKARVETLEGYFAKQIDETIASVEKDQSTSKYVSDPGFANAIQILSSGGSRLDLNVLKSLIAPFMDDHIAKKSIAAILSQQGRDPKHIGIDTGADALQILQGIKRDSSMTFRMWSGGNFPLTGSPQVIYHQLERANQILEGGFDPLLEVETF